MSRPAWRALAPLLSARAAPLQLEVHPAQRPEPSTLATLARELLYARGRGGATPAARTG